MEKFKLNMFENKKQKTVFSLKKYAYEINKTEIINKESNEQNFHSERILHTL